MSFNQKIIEAQYSNSLVNITAERNDKIFTTDVEVKICYLNQWENVKLTLLKYWELLWNISLDDFSIS